MKEMATTCEELKQQLSGYLDSEMDPLLCAELEHHLDECVNCRVVVDILCKTISLYREYDREPAPPEIYARLICVLNLHEPQIQHEREGRSSPPG